MAAPYNSDVQRHQAKVLALQGIPLREIARRLGRSANTVLSRAHRGEWEVRETQTTAAQIVEQSAQNVIRIGADYVRESGRRSRVALSNCVLKAAGHLESLEPPEIVERHQAVEGITRAADRLHGWSSKAEIDRLSVVNLAFLATPVSALPPREVQVQAEPQAQLDSSD
jgi:hypothetical protein